MAIPRHFRNILGIAKDAIQGKCINGCCRCVCVCVLTCLHTDKYDQIMRWWSSKTQLGIATFLDSAACCYVILPQKSIIMF